MSVKWKLYVFLMLNKHNMHRTFAFWSMRLSRKYASILHNRRACSALLCHHASIHPMHCITQRINIVRIMTCYQNGLSSFLKFQ